MFSQNPAIDATLFINLVMSALAIVSYSRRHYDTMSLALGLALIYNVFIGVCFLLVKYCA